MYATLIILRFLLIAGIVILILLIIYRRFIKKLIAKQDRLPKYASFSGDAVFHSAKENSWIAIITVPEEQELQLLIFDDSNRLVLTLHRGIIGSGNHIIPFSNEKLIKGKFVCRLESEGQKSERYFNVV